MRTGQLSIRIYAYANQTIGLLRRQKQPVHYDLCIGIPISCLLTMLIVNCSRRFHPGEGPIRGLLCDCEIFAKVSLKLYWTMLACWCRVNRSCHKCPSRRRRGPSCTSPSWCDAAAPQLFLPVTIRAAARQFLHLYKATQIFTMGIIFIYSLSWIRLCSILKVEPNPDLW